MVYLQDTEPAGKTEEEIWQAWLWRGQAANHSAYHPILIFPSSPETNIVLELLHGVR
jgi:hypothetical protein